MMNKYQNKFILAVLLVGVPFIDCLEFGKHDGGEYFYSMPGIAKGMHSELDGSQLELIRSGGGDGTFELNCSCCVNIPDEIDENYWIDRKIDFKDVRNQFPFFKTMVKNYPIIYLDSASTAQMPQVVIDAIMKYYETYKSNVGRGLYDFAECATFTFEQTRAKIAKFIGSKKQEIVFTSGATAGINIVAHIWADKHINAGDEIVVSEVEHNSNFIPWQQLAKRKGAVLKIVPLDHNGCIDSETLKQYLSIKTKLVAVTHQSNILGAVSDIASLSSAAHSVGAKILIDAAQSIAHQKIDVASSDCDFLVFSGHKLFGPTGVGALFIKQSLFSELEMQNFGGGMVYSVTQENSIFKDMPYCLEAGTQPIAQVIGLGAAIDFIQKNIDFDQANQHETALVCKFARELSKIPGVTIMSPIPVPGRHNNMVTFSSDKFHAYDIASFLDSYGIAVRAGFHCVQPYHDKLGGVASVRASFTVYNSLEEVDFVIECLHKMLLAN